MAGDDQELESRAVDRLIFFSDAVVAIAITLLAIDLPVPAGHSLSAFWSSVQHNEDRYLAFLVSFTAIAAAWGDHHGAFRFTRRMDPRLRTLNMAWLMMIVIVPFATKLLTVGSGECTTGSTGPPRPPDARARAGDHPGRAAQPVQRATWMLMTGPPGGRSRYCG